MFDILQQQSGDKIKHIFIKDQTVLDFAIIMVKLKMVIRHINLFSFERKLEI